MLCCPLLACTIFRQMTENKIERKWRKEAYIYTDIHAYLHTRVLGNTYSIVSENGRSHMHTLFYRSIPLV